MKTRMHVIVAAFALVMGTSVVAWPQQSQADNPQTYGQKMAANQREGKKMNAQAYTPEVKTANHKDKAIASDSIGIVGHLGFDGAVISNIRTTEDQTRSLLEVTDRTSQTLNLVDVSDPSHPKVVQRMRKPAELQNSRLEVAVGDAALFAETQDATPKPRSVSIVSFADRAGSRTVRRFENVTALWTDRGRGFIYLANPEGLWILQPHSLADRIALQKQAEEMWRSAQTP